MAEESSTSQHDLQTDRTLSAFPAAPANPSPNESQKSPSTGSTLSSPRGFLGVIRSRSRRSSLLKQGRRVRFSSGEGVNNDRETSATSSHSSSGYSPYSAPALSTSSQVDDHRMSYFGPNSISHAEVIDREDRCGYDVQIASTEVSNVGPTVRTPPLPPKCIPSLFRDQGTEDRTPSCEPTHTLPRIGSYSGPVSTFNSPIFQPSGLTDQLDGTQFDFSDLGEKNPDEEVGTIPQSTTSEAHKLVRAHTRRGILRSSLKRKTINDINADPTQGMEDSTEEQIRSGVLSSLLKLYHNNPRSHTSLPTSTSSGASTPLGKSPGKNTPKWYDVKSPNASVSSLGGFISSCANLITPGSGSETPRAPRLERPKDKPGKFRLKGLSRSSRIEEEIKITIHIAELLARQKYILRLCKALMLYGAPTHRLEEYMKSTSKVLEVDGQYLYIPGCMVISFDDPSTHTSDMHIVRVTQGCDLDKLHDTHIIYKEVVHDVIGVNEATKRLDEIQERPQKYNRWFLIGVYGLASATVGPFAFQARLIDMPMCFFLGCILGFLQLVLAPLSDVYSNVFEVSAAVLMSFLARALGSINDGKLFCFSALAQSSIALILPGYIILCGSLELQSKNIVAGSVRMIYAIIYSLFLGFGITIGAVIYGLLDRNATSATTCTDPLPDITSFAFVPPFALCLLICSQARWKQAPVMIFIAMAGYTVNFFSSRKFASTPQVANALGAFVVGVLGNFYSRFCHGHAFAAMLPGVFVQVPSGLASQGSIISGISNADAIVSNSTTLLQQEINITVLQLGFGMIQISIGITVGLCAAALLVYPFGKKRSSLFSF